MHETEKALDHDAYHNLAEVSQPGKEPFDFPASAIPPQGSAVLGQFPVRGDHFDVWPGQSRGGSSFASA